MKKMKYVEIRDSIKTGDRFEFASKSVLGSIIRWFTKEEVNHTALALSIDEYSNYPGNRKFLLEALPDGIDLRPASLDVQECKGSVYYTPLLSLFDSRRQSMADWGLQQVGKPYDYGNLFKNIFGAVNAEMKKFFCSEYYFVALVSAGIVPGTEIKGGKVVDLNGAPVKAPRPGEFGSFPIFGETIEIIP